LAGADGAAKLTDSQQCELRVARDRVQKKLDTATSENARLSRAAAEKDRVLADARTRVEYLEAALAAAEAECGRLTADAAKACDKHQAETSRAITAEKLLAEARERLLARIIEIDAVRQRVAQANAVTNAAYDRQRQLEDEKDQSARGAKRVARGCARSCRQSKPARPRNATVKSRGCRGRGASGLGRAGAPPWRLCGTQDSGHAGGAAGALRRLILSDLKARPPS
jgi:chromosome segregation ATPase